MLRPFLVAALALGVGPAAAQGLAAPDRDFLVQDAQGAAYELNLARLAADRAAREDVKSYARKLVADHDGYNGALQALGKAKGLQLPTEMTATAKLDAIKLLSGALFDKAFIAEAMRVNADDVAEADKEKAATHDDAIRSFLGKFAAMDSEHEALAKRLNDAK